jgi:hypothetical protein
VSRVKEFSLALLNKWCWRPRLEMDSLLFKVLTRKYGVEGGEERGRFI